MVVVVGGRHGSRGRGHDPGGRRECESTRESRLSDLDEIQERGAAGIELEPESARTKVAVRTPGTDAEELGEEHLPDAGEACVDVVATDLDAADLSVRTEHRVRLRTTDFEDRGVERTRNLLGGPVRGIIEISAVRPDPEVLLLLRDRHGCGKQEECRCDDGG